MGGMATALLRSKKILKLISTVPYANGRYPIWIALTIYLTFLTPFVFTYLVNFSQYRYTTHLPAQKQRRTWDKNIEKKR